MNQHTNIVGKQAQFKYPDYGTPDGYPEHTAHSGQMVTVLRKLDDTEVDPEVEDMYEIEAKDGWKGHVFRSELTVKSS